MQKIITEDGKTYLVISVNENIDSAFISRSGKSLVFRINGIYLKANGVVIGKAGEVTGRINKPLDCKVTTITRKTYQHRDIIKYDFGNDNVRSALKIIIHKQ